MPTADCAKLMCEPRILDRPKSPNLLGCRVIQGCQHGLSCRGKPNASFEGNTRGPHRATYVMVATNSMMHPRALIDFSPSFAYVGRFTAISRAGMIILFPSVRSRVSRASPSSRCAARRRGAPKTTDRPFRTAGNAVGRTHTLKTTFRTHENAHIIPTKPHVETIAESTQGGGVAPSDRRHIRARDVAHARTRRSSASDAASDASSDSEGGEPATNARGRAKSTREIEILNL